MADLIGECLAAHGVPGRCVPDVVANLAITCHGGLQTPTLRAVERQIRNERIRREFRGGADYAGLARRWRLSVWQVRNIVA